MALSLAACGGSSTTTTTSTTATDTTVTADAATSSALTTSTDIKALGSGDDTVLASGSTFGSDDTISDAGGADSLTVTVAPASGAAETVIANISGVETVNVVNGGAAAYTMNMIGATGATELASRLSSNDVTFTNVQSAATITADGTTAGETTAGFLNSLASGAADAVTVSVKAGATAHFNVGGTTAANEFETINVSSTGGVANTISTIEASDSTILTGITALSVTGDTDLTMGAVAAADTSSVNASAFTGDLTLTAVDNQTTITMGAGSDTLDATVGVLGTANALKTFVGGEGDDTIKLSENVSATTMNPTASTTDHSISGFETVQVVATVAQTDNANLAIAVDASEIADATTFVATIDNNDTDNTDAAAVTFSGLSASQAVSFTSQGDAQTVNSVIVSLDDATGTADSITVTSANPTAATDVNQLAVLTVTGAVETLNLVASADDVTTTAGTTIADLNAGTTATVAVSGSGGLAIGTMDLSDAAGTGVTSNFNASAATGDVTLGAASADFKDSNAEEFTVTFGSGTNAAYAGTAALDEDNFVGTTGTDTLYLSEAASGTLATTVTSIDNVEVQLSTTASDAQTISLANFTDVGKVTLVAASSDAPDEGITVSNIGSSQAIHLKTGTTKDFEGDVITLTNATGVTGLGVTLEGAVALHSGGVAITTDAGTVSVTDTIAGADGFFENGTVTLAGTAATADVTGVTLAGGGASSASVTAVMTLAGTSNVALTSIDASGLSSDLVMTGVTTAAAADVTLGSGDNSVTIALADGVRDALNIDSGNGTDTMVMAELVNTDYRPGLANLETLDLDLAATMGGAGTLNLVEADSVATIELDLDSGDQNFTVSNASNTSYVLEASMAAATDILTLGSGTTLTVSNGAAVGATAGSSTLTVATPDATTLTLAQGHGSAINAATLTAAAATTINFGGTAVDANGDDWAGAMRIETLSAAELLTLNIDASQGARTVDTLTAAKLTTLNATGDNAVVITGGTTTALSSVAASGLTGALTIGQAVDFTSTASVTMGTAADTITLDIGTEANLVVDAGEKSGTDVSDTLAYAGASNQGLTAIDLSSSTDQVSQINGVLNSAAQTNFEAVDMSGLTGSFGVNITGSSEANVITGTAQADVITAGDGADVITGGDGIDTLTGGAGIDTFTFASTAATNDADVISDFTSGASGDILNLDAFLGTSAAFLDAGGAPSGAIGATNAGAETTGTSISAKVVLIDTDVVADTTAINALITADDTVDEKLLLTNAQKAVILHGDVDGTGTGDYSVYFVTGTDTASDDTETITLVGTLQNVDLDALVAANLF